MEIVQHQISLFKCVISRELYFQLMDSNPYNSDARRMRLLDASALDRLIFPVARVPIYSSLSSQAREELSKLRALLSNPDNEHAHFELIEE